METRPDALYFRILSLKDDSSIVLEISIGQRYEWNQLGIGVNGFAEMMQYFLETPFHRIPVMAFPSPLQDFESMLDECEAGDVLKFGIISVRKITPKAPK